MFGALSITGDGVVLGPRDLGGQKMRQLFEVLLAARGRPVTNERLALHLWGDNQPQYARPALAHCVCVLRRNLARAGERAAGLVVTHSGAYRFRNEHAEVDLDRFDDLLEQAGRETGAARRRALEGALELVRGDLLDDEHRAPWALTLRDAYRQRVDDLRLDVAEAALTARDFRLALAHAQTATLHDPYSERPHQIAMLAQYALGRRHQALEAFEALRSALLSELGLEPMPQTSSLDRAIREQVDAALLLPPQGPEADAPRQTATGLPVVTVVEGAENLHREVKPLARALGARLGAGRGRSTADALRAALAAAIGRDAPSGSLVDAVRQHAPLLLVVEGLEREDADGAALFEELQHACSDVPVVVLASYDGAETSAAPAAARSVVSGDTAKTWLLRVVAPLAAAARAIALLPLWLDDVFGLDEAFDVLTAAFG
jgi:DNA-binding SARP family transcriptional activator